MRVSFTNACPRSGWKRIFADSGRGGTLRKPTGEASPSGLTASRSGPHRRTVHREGPGFGQADWFNGLAGSGLRRRRHRGFGDSRRYGPGIRGSTRSGGFHAPRDGPAQRDGANSPGQAASDIFRRRGTEPCQERAGAALEHANRTGRRESCSGPGFRRDNPEGGNRPRAAATGPVRA